MSVDLTQLPDLLPPLKKFNGWFWAILLLVFIIVGSIVTLITSFYLSTSNLLFILGCLILPGCGWLVSFLYGIYYRGYREAYIEQWNHHRNQRKQALIDYARRGLYVLQHNLITEYSSGKNGEGVAKGEYAITTKVPYSGNNPIPHSALPLPMLTKSSVFQERIKQIFNDWQKQYQPLFATLPMDINLHVRLFIDTSQPIDNLEQLWLQTLGKSMYVTSFNIESSQNSGLFIQQWLDNSDHDHDLLLLVNAHLFSSPKKYEAEEALFMLLAGEKALNAVSSIMDTSKLVKIYRSEQTSELNKTLDHALLWGEESQSPYDGVWYSDITNEQNVAIMNYFNEADVEQGDIFNIDTTIGNAQESAYFFAVALAVEHALTTGNKQLIIVGLPDITASVVASVTKNRTTKIRE